MTFAAPGPIGTAAVGIAMLLAFAAAPPAAARDLESDARTALILGEALFMAGNFPEASSRLLDASTSPDDRISFRALYLLGRLSLLTGDYRQGKEYFERAAERGAKVPGARWMALAGIGDSLLAGSRAEEAARRYREALSESTDTFSEAFIEVKLAVCERSMGRRKEASKRLRGAIERLPILSPWKGREEEFFLGTEIQGVQGAQAPQSLVSVVVGPVPEGFLSLGEMESAAGVPRRSVAKNRQLFYEFGPFADPVEATIFAQTVRSRYSLEARVTGR